MLSRLSNSWFQFLSFALTCPAGGCTGVGCDVGTATLEGTGVGTAVGVGATGTGGLSGCCMRALNSSGVILRLGPADTDTVGAGGCVVTVGLAGSMGMLVSGSAALSASLRKSTA